ncbi:MAG: hypothetical protein Q4E21_04975 [Clostridia bacterium]|nr:hypothetical protein [Clostridia bacterium]
MVKKIYYLIILILILLICFFTSCVSKSIKSNLENETPFTSRELQIDPNAIVRETLHDTSHSQSEIRIAYPVFVNNSMEIINQDIFSFVSEITSNIYGTDYENLYLQMDYEIKLFNQKYLSIVFHGLGESQSAYPNNIFLTRNYDLEQHTNITLSDLYCLDMDFAQKIYSRIEIQKETNIIEIFKADYSTINAFSQTLLSCDTNTSSFQSYLTTEGIGVCMPIRHVGGDYVTIELNNSEISKWAVK